MRKTINARSHGLTHGLASPKERLSARNSLVGTFLFTEAWTYSITRRTGPAREDMAEPEGIGVLCDSGEW